MLRDAGLPRLAAILSVCVWLVFVSVIESQETKTTPVITCVFQLLTPTEGVDFSRYGKDVFAKIRRNWYGFMPESAQLGAKGRVVVRFQIGKDGKLFVKEPTVESSSNDKQLDNAAISAIKSSAPFKPLPDAFHGPEIELRALFLYNVPLPSGLVPN